MFFKKLPLSLVLFFSIMGSGFFYAQTNFLPNQCPLGRPEHRTFICQCAPPSKSILDSVPKFYLGPDTMYCPLGKHKFICQCAPRRVHELQAPTTKKKKRRSKK